MRFEKGGERGMRKAAQGIEKEKGGERGAYQDKAQNGRLPAQQAQGRAVDLRREARRCIACIISVSKCTRTYLDSRQPA